VSSHWSCCVCGGSEGFRGNDWCGGCEDEAREAEDQRRAEEEQAQEEEPEQQGEP